MADLFDVEEAFADLISGWCYPAGTSSPSAVLVGGDPLPVRVGRGWPVKTDLDRALALGIAHVSVYPAPGMERVTTRYDREWSEAPPIFTLAATAASSSITFSGSPQTGLNVGVLLNGLGYVYGVQAGDTLASIAAAIATLTGGTSAGPVVSLPGARGLAARVGGVGSASRELRRVQRLFQITVWVSDPASRDVLSAFLDLQFAALDFLSLSDGAARLQYVRTAPTDRDELSNLFRRDLFYSVEFATVETDPATQIVLAKTDQGALSTVS